jgi:hypothetical protein
MMRDAKPYYRTARKKWFANIDGRQISLGITDPEDRAGAEAAYAKLLLEGPPPDRPAPPADALDQLAELIAEKVHASIPPPAPLALPPAPSTPLRALREAAALVGAEMGLPVSRLVLLDAAGRNLLELAVQ